MIVKPISFKKGGRYPTAVARAEYLQRDGRAVELGTQNMARGDSSWACEMDSTTAAYPCRGDVVAREYVLSPAPGDMATPAQMLDFGMQWAAENFPGHEASVVIHVDNRDRIARGLEPIPHAHVYINSVNLETGKKMHISRDFARRLHDSAQRMAMERGWSQQIEYQSPDGLRYIESQRSANRGMSRPITILADEFHSMPPFRSFIDSIENGRKCGFRWVVICQNFNSLAKYDHGGERGLNQILGNMSLIVSYGARLADEAKIMSELSGTRTLLAKSTGTSDGPSGSGSNEGLSEREAPVWAVSEIMNRDPRRDGVLVIKSVDGRPDRSGAFEILQRDVTERPTAKNFGTFGSREFEAEVINAEVEKATARPADDAEVECWVPDFNQKRDDDPAGESLDDLFGLSG